MEVAAIGLSSVKLKGKNTSILINPSGDVNSQASAALLFQKGADNFPKIEGLRLVISGAGEYEVGGVKVTGIASNDSLVFEGEMDGTRFVSGTSEGIEKASSKIDEAQVLIIDAGENFNPSIVSTLSPGVCIIYGSQSQAAAKALGKDNLSKTSKVAIKGDKLPEETEIVMLG